ncbi:MAG: hypothetical protein ACREBU_04195 [Nitrososphaera sp.]
MANRMTSTRYGNTERRGVGGIIAGVILAAILLTTVLVYFITILNNEKARTGYEIQSLQENRDKETETYKVERALAVSGGNINIKIVNKGPIPMVASYSLVYCEAGCSTPPSEPIQTLQISKVLNPGDSDIESVGGGTLVADNSHRYRIDAISERGNIVSSITCTVLADGTCSEDDAGGDDEEDPCPTCQITEGIIQGTGSAQLDFRSFGTIYPTLGSRAGVNQQGWLVSTASPYGSVTGYPAFEVLFASQNGGSPPDVPIVYVERMRNLDLFNETLTLSRSTSVLTNIGKEIGNQQDIEFICNATKTFSGGVPTGGSLAGYNENTRATVLPWTPLNASATVGWKEVYFCTQTPGSGNINYAPRNTFNSFHPLFMVIRGTFEPSNSDYGQTVPYQSSLPGGTVVDSFEACLRSSNALPPSGTHLCPGPNNTSSNADLIYSASKSTMTGTGQNAWVHIDTVTSPVTVSWIYPNGTQAILEMTNGQPARDQTLAANGYVPFEVKLPVDVTCDGGTNAQSYIIKVSDQYDSNGRRNVYYMTWRVTCP